MGYDVHITRKEDWSDEDGPDIAIDEWLSLVNGDPEMRLDGFAETQTAEGSLVRMESAGLSVWTAYSGHEEDGNKAWFDYHSGGITVKNPDKEILIKMWQLAQQLSATVQGDEGEQYDQSGSVIGAGATKAEAINVSKPWWKLW